MNIPCDIFGRLPSGKPLWMECVEGLDQARQRVHELASTAPREYFIYSEASGIVESGDTETEKMLDDKKQMLIY